ncbi:MAG: flagellar export chaperone FliS [Bacillota bacterium]
MSTADVYRTYMQNQVQTLPPEKLVLMLYDGALKFINQGKQACEVRDIEKTNYYLGRAQAILAELMGNLVKEAGEIAEHLFALYDYMYRRLVESNINKDPQPIDEVYDLLHDLRNTWAELIRMNLAKPLETSVQRKGLIV